MICVECVRQLNYFGLKVGTSGKGWIGWQVTHDPQKATDAAAMGTGIRDFNDLTVYWIEQVRVNGTGYCVAHVPGVQS